MKSLIQIVLALVFAGAAAFGQVGDNRQATNIGGIHYAVPRAFLEPSRWRDELQHSYDCQSPCTVAFDERLSAVFLRYKWMQLNPEEGVYDFSDLGGVIDQVNKSGKMVTLVIMAGKYTPSWVFRNGAGHIQTLAIKNDNYSQEFIPLPWDPTFLAAYDDMLSALADYLRQSPDRYRAVVMIKNGSVVVHSEEIRLMPYDAFNVNGHSPSEKEKLAFEESLCQDWAQSGYSEQKILKAMTNTSEKISQSFPEKYIGLAFVDGSNRFPTVNRIGQCALPKENETISKIIKEFVTTYKARAVINSTVLTDKIGNPPIMSWVLRNGGKIGFQVNERMVGCRKGTSDICDRDLFKRTIQAGTSAGATFIEVHEGDINRYNDLLPELNVGLSGR